MLARNALLRLRWLVLLLPAFALFSTVQVGCTGGRDDFAREDPKAGGPDGGPGGRPGAGPGGSSGGGYYGYDDDDDGYGYGYE